MVIHRASKSGVTLMELMTVLIIIAILAVMLIPFIGLLRQRAEVASCTQNMKGLYAAGVNYITEAKHWPQVDTNQVGKPDYARAWYEAFQPYGVGWINWVCPRPADAQ